MAAFVGAGGKSSAMLTVADELAQAGMKVLVAPTTKMLVSEAQRIGPLVTSEDAGELRMKAEEAFSNAASGVVVGSGLLSKNRVGGVEPADIPSSPRSPTWCWSRPTVAAPDQRHSRSRASPA